MSENENAQFIATALMDDMTRPAAPEVFSLLGAPGSVDRERRSVRIVRALRSKLVREALETAQRQEMAKEQAEMRERGRRPPKRLH